MKVYGLFKCEMIMPFMHETLIDVYARKADAETECKSLNDTNPNPMQEDDYGPLEGCRYFVAELEIK
jgi:hypothetical protein